MPIKVTDHQGNVTVTHRGEVVEVRRFFAQRNHSDTLDYTDFRTTRVTEALVYVGRTAGEMHRKEAVPAWKSWPEAYYAEGQPLAPEDRFKLIDCTNLFTYRGADRREPTVDDIRHPDVVIDYAEYLEAMARINAAREARAADEAAQQRADKEQKERHRPVVGKRMVVVSGRKVKPGTQGTVAYVKADGGVLLKDDDKWQDRKANGTWVDGRHLRAR